MFACNVTFMSMSNDVLRGYLRTITTWGLSLYVLLWVLGRNHNFLFLLLLSWLFAIAMEPAIRWVSRRGFSRSRSVGVVMITLIILAAAFFALFGGILLTQASSLVNDIPSLITDVVNWLNTTFTLTIDPQEIITALDVSPSQIAGIASDLAGGVFGVISMLLGGIFQLLTLLLFAFYFAAEAPQVRRVLGSWLQPSQQAVFAKTWDIAVAKTAGFVVSKIELAVASAAVHSIAFAVIGVPYWLAMGLITGIISQFIPTVGTYLGVLIPVLFAFFVSPIDALWVIIVASVYQQVENYLISPRISRATMDIHPAIAFGSVIVFANLFGALGALISIPLAAAIVAVMDTYGKRYDLIPELHEDKD